ncbi:MAG: STAS domain-containing protein [Bacteroidales bacterium]|nr:STAS domain-containing protein [Bacteroidales bacterium]
MKKGDINFIIIQHQRTNVNVSFEKTDKINVHNAEIVKYNLAEIIRVPHTNLILSLGGIRFIDSAGFRALNFISRIAKNYNSSIVLKDVDKDLFELFDLVKKFGRLEIIKIQRTRYKTVNAA